MERYKKNLPPRFRDNGRRDPKRSPEAKARAKNRRQARRVKYA